MAATFIAETGEFTLPDWVVDINAYRRWRDADDYPEHGRIWWLQGKIWADMSREQIFTHLGAKGEISSFLHRLVKARNRGLFIPDGVLLSNFAAEISGNPDAVYISEETYNSDRIRLIEGSEKSGGGFVELQGSPDMVLEVVSKSSVHKDNVILRRAYWEAGIREYWLVDARKAPPSLEILRYTARGYVATRKREDGWVKSAVFGQEFRFLQGETSLGHPQYTLEMR